MAPPSTRTSGRAPTEVRTGHGGRSYSRVRQGARRGILRRYSRGLRGTKGSAVYSVGPGGLPDTRARAHARTHALPAPHTRTQKLAHAHAHTLGRMHAHARAHARVYMLICGDTLSLSPPRTCTHSHAHTYTHTHTCRLHLNPHACACTHIQRSRHSMTGFGTCVGTVRHSACVQFIARACVCATDTCAFCVGHRPFAHLCRRCQLDLAHHQRAVGCPGWAHERDRRRRRHLRHRRLRRQHLL